VKRHEFLRGLHAVVQPRSYFEVGVNDGRSLALSRARSIAIDPAFKVTAELACDLRLVAATSDDYFARPDPIAHFPERVVDLAFIDGMHLFEFALRDFLNLERLAAWSSVVVFDDMLPRSVDEAARDRHTNAWTGDVYKLQLVLQRLRPDLVVLPVDTEPTGVMVVLGADPASTALSESYDDLLAEFVRSDPQPVPEPILRRAVATDPERLLAADFWPRLVAARDAGADRADPNALAPLLAAGRELRPDVALETELPPAAAPAPPTLPAAAAALTSAPGRAAATSAARRALSRRVRRARRTLAKRIAP